MQLPEEFLRTTEALMGRERFERYLHSFEEESPVSIRLNPMKGVKYGEWNAERVPWCADGYYLPRRPNFTFDPLLHSGCYYVQEAASMFLDTVLRQHLPPSSPLLCLDLCAAPGGKSTLLRSVLPEESVLYSNEPVRQRANILLENVQKWGYANHYVTNLYPRDYRKAKMRFDVILCDVPCSGEGMFRKDAATIGEWSPQNVDRCWQLQREIVSDAWACLNDGGLLIYSTCTFNTKENEENIRWMLSEFDAQVLPVDTQPAWNITGSLLEGFGEPVYRFIPGISRGEGLFVCALRKGGSLEAKRANARSKQPIHSLPPADLHTDGPRVELNYQQAIAYLRHEALVLPADAPRGVVEVCFMGHPMGMVKNIGSRANNLYPKEWRIKSTYAPNDYEPVIY